MALVGGFMMVLWFYFLQFQFIMASSLVETVTSRSNRHFHHAIKYADNLVRSRHRLMMTDGQKSDIGSMSIEELVNLADNEMELKLLNNQEELNQKKREIIQKKKDKLYEKYWEQRSKSTSTNSELATFNQYYGLMAPNGTYSGNGNKNTMDYKIEPLNPRQNVIASLGAIGVVGAAFLTKYILAPTVTSTRISTRMVKVDYPIEKLFAETKKVVLNKEILLTLPGLSKSRLSSLRLFRGRVPSFSADKVYIIVYWNPTDQISVTAVNRIEMFTKEFPNSYNFVTIVASDTVDSIPSTAIASNILIDDNDRSIMLELGISTLPTVIVCATNDNISRIIFGTEGSTASTDITGRCLSAVATVLSSSIEDAPTYAELQRTWRSTK